MKLMSIRRSMCSAILGLAALAMTSCGGGSANNSGGGTGGVPPVANNAAVVATVNDDKITREDWVREMELQHGREVLESMILEKLVFQEAKKSNITVDDKELQSKRDEMMKNPQLKELMKSQNVPPAILDEKLKAKLLLDKLILKQIPEQDKLTFYDQFKPQITLVKLAHIVVPDKEQAQKLRDQLKNGADFGKLAKEHSMDPTSKNSGGDLGWMMRRTMNPAVAKVTQDLKLNELSQPVQSQAGYHIIKVTGIKSSYDELKSTIETGLTEMHQQDYLKRLRAKANVTNKLSNAPATPAASPAASSPKPK